jgi:hypothetical protein
MIMMFARGDERRILCGGRMIEGSEGFVMNGRGVLMTSFRARDETS